MKNLEKINNLENLDTSNIINAEGMFKKDESLTEIDFSAHTFRPATNISHMFEDDKKLETITFGSNAFKNIVDGSYAFANDTSLKNIKLYDTTITDYEKLSATNSWRAEYATDLRSMFKNDSNLSQLNLYSWDFKDADTGNSVLGEGMFDGTNLESIVLNEKLKFDSHTALTSKKGTTWISVEHRVGSDKKIAFSGIPTFDKDGNAFNGIGSLYVGKGKVRGIDSNGEVTEKITYKASDSLKKGQLVNNLVTIPTNQGDIIIVVEGSFGNSVEEREEWKNII